jgi:eukaryotic-like serine/threonine-protein kinase
MTGQTIAHYKIVSHIGAGAMGDVFKASDTKLQRTVAIKCMSPALSTDASATRRFLQEARAASALDHANICTIYEAGKTDQGQLYLVMAYYEGETLAARIARGRLPVDQAMSIGYDVASGLDRAHQYGIVHRDITPANLFITRFGEVKILDFGLAKLRGEAVVTEQGLLLGTVPYMSPEQASGAPVDHRTDIWSLGVVWFEMLTGRRPFVGDTTASTIASILHEEPPWTTLGPEVPAAAIELLEHALQKVPERRIQSCSHIVRVMSGYTGPEAVTQLTVRPLPPARHCLLVLPFVALAGDIESEYFGIGLADEIMTALSHVPSLRVMARSAAERVQASGQRLRFVARELGVEYVVEGTVRRHGTLLRVSANLMEVRTGSLAWAEQFSGVLEDIFAIQEQLSAKIADALRVRLDADVRPRHGVNALDDITSYDYYLRAKREFVRYEPGGLERALSFIESARTRSGDNVLLLAAAGQIYWQLVNSGSTPDRLYLEKAEACAKRLMEIDESGPHGPRLLGMVRLLEGNIRDTILELELAASRDPNDTDTLSLLGPCYGYIGRPQAGMPIVTRLLELDPLTPMYQSLPGYLWLMAGSFDRAMTPFAKSYDMDPGNPLVGLSYGQCLALNEHVPAAIEVFDDLQRRTPGAFMARLGQLYKCALLKQPDQARIWVTPEVEAIASWDLYHSWNLAQCFALLGEHQRALFWLQRSVERGMLNYPLLVALDPFVASIRETPGYDALMKAVRLQWETFVNDPTTKATLA